MLPDTTDLRVLGNMATARCGDITDDLNQPLPGSYVPSRN